MAKLIIEPSPHIKSAMTTQKIMLCVIIALLPALIASVWIFGLRALVMTVVCCAACVVFEWITRKIMVANSCITTFASKCKFPYPAISTAFPINKISSGQNGFATACILMP